MPIGMSILSKIRDLLNFDHHFSDRETRKRKIDCDTDPFAIRTKIRRDDSATRQTIINANQTKQSHYKSGRDNISRLPRPLPHLNCRKTMSQSKFVYSNLDAELSDDDECTQSILANIKTTSTPMSQFQLNGHGLSSGAFGGTTIKSKPSVEKSRAERKGPPNLEPIYTTHKPFNPDFSHSYFFNKKSTLRHPENGMRDIKRTTGLNVHSSTISDKMFNMDEKSSYNRFLQERAPSIYKSNGLDLFPAVFNKQHAPIDTMGRSHNLINFSREENGLPERSKLQFIASTSKAKSPNVRNHQIIDVEPVNSLLRKLDLKPNCKSEWVPNITKRYSSSNEQRKILVAAHETESKRLEKNTRAQEREIESTFKKYIDDNEVIILSESEDEDELELPEITVEQQQFIKQAVSGGSPNDTLVTKFNMSIKRRDVHTLLGATWLNDEVINFYMNLLTERSELQREDGLPAVYAMNTFFMERLANGGHAAVRRWTRKIDIFSYDIIPVPLHVGKVHWCMAIIHLRDKTIKYYDSMGSPNPAVIGHLERYLQEESIDKRKLTFDMSDWTKESCRDIPQQMNSSDCGVFSCMFAEFITRDRSISFTQEHMQYFRKKMILEIATGKMIT